VQDQRFVEKRPDVLSWKTDVLQEDVTLTGQVTAKLFAEQRDRMPIGGES